MCLVPHHDRYRRLWMFPRNKRRVDPWWLAQVVTLLLQQVRHLQWSGNRELQAEYCLGLEQVGLKRPGVQYDPNSGGPRTYLAQMQALGLVFSRENGQTFLTIAGEGLASGNPPLPIMRELILKHQYPSHYSGLPNVRIHPDIRVKPFVFILQLLSHPDIGSLTKEEIAVAVIYGHNHRCLDLCVEKILLLRGGASFEQVLDNPAEDLYTNRSRRATRAARIRDVLDIANTCKNYMQACNLIDVERVGPIHRTYFSEYIRPLYERAIENLDRFLPVHSEESFQRRYGAIGRQRDTRHLGEVQEASMSPPT